MAHRALSQRRDDISQSRKRLVDVFSLIQDGSCSSSLTDLERRKRQSEWSHRNSHYEVIHLKQLNGRLGDC